MLHLYQTVRRNVEHLKITSPISVILFTISTFSQGVQNGIQNVSSSQLLSEKDRFIQSYQKSSCLTSKLKSGPKYTLEAIAPISPLITFIQGSRFRKSVWETFQKFSFNLSNFNVFQDQKKLSARLQKDFILHSCKLRECWSTWWTIYAQSQTWRMHPCCFC